MKTLNASAAVEWARTNKIHLGEHRKPLGPEAGLKKCRFVLPKSASKQVSFCRFIERSLRPWERCLFWVTEWGIWESSENWHLYYRLRQSYGDHLLIEEASAHLFLEYEVHDLISFIQIGLTSGWDFTLLTRNDYTRIFVSHDEWVEFMTHDEIELEKIQSELLTLGLEAIPEPA